jgi:hypothetical protein
MGREGFANLSANHPRHVAFSLLDSHFVSRASPWVRNFMQDQATYVLEFLEKV